MKKDRHNCYPFGNGIAVPREIIEKCIDDHNNQLSNNSVRNCFKASELAVFQGKRRLFENLHLTTNKVVRCQLP